MTNEKICRLISALLDHAEKCGMLDSADRIYAANTICTELHLTAFEDYVSDEEKGLRLHEILDAICEYAVANNIINEGITAHDLFDTKLMGLLMPRPSEVTAKFFELYKNDPKAASDYFYRLSIYSNYIREDRVEKDRRWSVDSEYGKIDISINLSKPEKDPKDIAAAKLAPQSGYPKCLLCPENVGYAGHANAPARQNLRQIPFTLGGDEWLLQYSPYVYYNEHCIALSKAHVPMKICRATFERQLDFVTELPHYFIGSNADIPIVGGSILSHDHMQGGCYTFPMERAEVIIPVKFEKYPDVTAGIVNWPMSVLRLRSANKSALVDLAEEIRVLWADYSDEANGVVAYTDGVPHNAITPIARRRDGDFELDLVLRNNLTSEEFPMGIYHPHADKHNIKKENIGLIEVMGLAVLPARLRDEISTMCRFIAEGRDFAEDESIVKHKEWYEELCKEYTFTPENTENILKQEIGKVFERVLEDAGVYKRTEEGQEAFLRFVSTVR